VVSPTWVGSAVNCHCNRVLPGESPTTRNGLRFRSSERVGWWGEIVDSETINSGNEQHRQGANGPARYEGPGSTVPYMKQPAATIRIERPAVE